MNTLDGTNEYMPRSSGSTISVMLVIAILQGLLLWWISYTADLGIWPGTDSAVSSALFGFAFFMAPVLYALSPWWRGISAWLLALVIGLILALSSWHAGAHESAPGAFNVLPMHDLLSGLFVVQLVLLFHAIPFLQSYLQNGHWRTAYTDLFRFSWDNAVHLALAMLFTGIAWLLLWLCSELFDMLGLPFLRIVLQEIPGYSWLILSLAFGIGFFLVGSSERLLVGLRQQVLTLLKWLTPVAATVLVAFSVALIIRTPWLLSEHRHVISAKWLLSLVIVAVYLYNAAYQDGQVQTPYSRRLGQMLSKVTPLLALLSIMAAYDLWVRIDAYGLTSTRYWAVVVSIVAVTYAVGYSVAGFRGSRWMSGMGPTNVAVAIAIIALLTLSMTPVLYPGRLAARSQAHRLAQSDGTAGPRDFMSLRFDAGGYGYDELASLVEDSKVPPAIRKGAQAAIAVKDWQDERSFTYTTIPAVNVLLEAFPAGALIDADLRLKIASLVPGALRSGGVVSSNVDMEVSLVGYTGTAFNEPKLGTPEFPHPVLFVDLDGDGQAEAIVFLQQTAMVYQRQATGWTETGTMYWRQAQYKMISVSELRTALRAGDYRAVAPRWQQLQIGKRRYSVPSNE